MSAFVHSDENFDEVAKTIARQLFTTDYNKKSFAQKTARLIEDNYFENKRLSYTKPANLFSTEEDKQEWYIERFCEDMAKANQLSVATLYGERAKGYFGDALTTPYKCSIAKSKARTLSLVELVKRLHSIEYQSDNVPNWETTETGKILRQIIAMLEHVIVTGLQEYNDAKTWG